MFMWKIERIEYPWEVLKTIFVYYLIDLTVINKIGYIWVVLNKNRYFSIPFWMTYVLFIGQVNYFCLN